MATLVSRGVKISLVPSSKTPDGFSPQAYEDFADWQEASPVISVQVTKENVHDADKVTTFGNIMYSPTDGVETLVGNMISQHYSVPENLNTSVEYWVHVTDIQNTYCPTDQSSDAYTNNASNYNVRAQYFVKTIV